MLLTHPPQSYPMHHANISTNYAYLPHNVDPTIPIPDEYRNMPISPFGPDLKERYEEYQKGCVDYYNEQNPRHAKGGRCTMGERDRIDMIRRQPKSLYNYTKLGFAKLRAPDHVFALLQEFWKANRGKETKEEWVRKYGPFVPVRESNRVLFSRGPNLFLSICQHIQRAMCIRITGRFPR
jgi:hypothetical protein